MSKKMSKLNRAVKKTIKIARESNREDEMLIMMYYNKKTDKISGCTSGKKEMTEAVVKEILSKDEQILKLFAFAVLEAVNEQ